MKSRYDVVRLIGEGGMGRVYEAVHRPSGRVVAIKTLRSELEASRAQRLFVNEAAAVAQVAHANIVELLDVGRDERGSMFLVMEYVRGTSLERWEEAFPGMRAVFTAFDRILDALATAHAQGVVHGDLKPANVLCAANGDVKLTDFGVAHVLDPLKPERASGIRGTPFYMAPEQLVDTDAIGPPTDLYAVGMMLHGLVSEEAAPQSESFVAMATRKLAGPPPLTPRPGLDVPPVLAALITSLLDPNPRTRPRFAARVRDALADIAERMCDATVPVTLTMDAGPTRVDPTLVTVASTERLPQVSTHQSMPFALPSTGDLRPDVSLHTLRPLPLVGRRAQRDRLGAAVHDVIRTNRPRCLLVSGRAGEGKTRIVRQGFADVEREGTMLGAAASFDETITNAQVGLRACVKRLLGEPAQTLEETLAYPWKWLTRAPQPGVDLARAHEWLSEDRALDAKSAATIAAECLLAAGRIHPIYLWLDDVAWSRDGAMELVTLLLERSEARVLVVGTLRSGTAEHPQVRAWLDAALQLGARHEIIGALDAPDRAELVSAAIPVSRDIAERFARKLDEPALIVVETVRAWFAEGARESEIATASPASVLTRRIAAVIDGFGAAREDAERVLFHAALLGAHFQERALRACAGVEEHVDAVLDRALFAGLLRVDGRAAYRFEHRMFLDAIVERGGLRADANAIRLATAAALVGTYGSREAGVALVAAKLSRAAGDSDSAMRVGAEAIAASIRSSRFDTAAEVLALLVRWNEEDALPEGHLHRAITESARGQIAYFKLDYARAREHLRSALAIFERVGTRADVHITLFHLSSAHFYDDQFAEAERCVAFVNEPVADPLCHARGYHRLAELATMRDDLESTIAYETRTRDLCVGQDPHWELIVHMNIVGCYVAAGRIDDAVAALAAAQKVVDAVGDRNLKQELVHTLAVVDAARGDFAVARLRAMRWREALAARDDKWQMTAALAVIMLCTAGLGDGNLDEAVDAFVTAYNAAAHDEAITWWCIRGAAGWLGERNRPDLADRLTQMFDARLARMRDYIRLVQSR